MLFALICIDKPDHTDLRASTRAEHVAYLKSSAMLSQAGPFLNDAGDMVGSLIILDVADKAAAEHWASEAPYAKVGLFESVEIRAWTKVI